MKRVPLVFLCCLLFLMSSAQKEINFRYEIKTYQADQNKMFKDVRTSPLEAVDLESFESLKFYRPKKSYRVVANFVRTAGTEPFEMSTTTGQKPIYEKYGELLFEINGKPQILNVYQSHDSRRNPLYRNKLFLPFKDKTNGNKTYGGGRFIDLKIPGEDTIIIDFNKAYNPLCVYNLKFSCPIVPSSNHLDIPIRAGVKNFKKK